MTNTDTYLSMLHRGKAIEKNGAMPEVRVALLANFSTQQLVFVLKAALLEVELYPEVYEAEYDTAILEALDPSSELYRFQPHFTIIGLAVQQYRERFLACVSPQERELLPQKYQAEILEMVRALREHQTVALVTNLALPLERMFGNFGLLTHQSLYGSVLAFNRMLQESVPVVDVMYLASVAGAADFLDEKLWLMSKYLCTNKYLPGLTRSIARMIAVGLGKVKKCLVLDLDNTLWGGVVGDDGVEGIEIGHGSAYAEAFELFQRYLLSLKQRGFILAVCSKNNEETARAAFREHPDMVLQELDFAMFVANWSDKHANIELIARTLDIGLDSIVFIDDSPFERELVRRMLPAVTVPEMPEEVADFIAAIENSGVLEASSYSEEDFGRNQMYREEAARVNESARFSDIDEYLRTLDLQTECGPFTRPDLPRIVQLLQRSNQFNLRTQRFDEQACGAFLQDPSRYFTWQARLRDRLGDYGLIAAICGERTDSVLNITELVMSCRVLRRGMEEFMINMLVEYCRRNALRGVQGEYIRSSKNSMVCDFYPKYGFAPVAGNGHRELWFLDVGSASTHKTFVREA